MIITMSLTKFLLLCTVFIVLTQTSSVSSESTKVAPALDKAIEPSQIGLSVTPENVLSLRSKSPNNDNCNNTGILKVTFWELLLIILSNAISILTSVFTANFLGVIPNVLRILQGFIQYFFGK